MCLPRFLKMYLPRFFKINLPRFLKIYLPRFLKIYLPRLLKMYLPRLLMLILSQLWIIPGRQPVQLGISHPLFFYQVTGGSSQFSSVRICQKQIMNSFVQIVDHSKESASAVWDKSESQVACYVTVFICQNQADQDHRWKEAL